jgi:hypothetical protein
MDKKLLDDCKEENKALKNTINSLEETWGIIVGNLIKAVIKDFGNEGRRTIKESMFKSGLILGDKYVRSKNIKKKDLKAFANYFNDISDVEIFKIKVDVLNNNEFTIRTKICPYLKYWKEIGIDKDVPDFCKFTTAADLGIAKAFDKKIAFKLKKNMLSGDDCCIYSFKKT